MNPARGLGPASRPGPQKWGDPRGELSAEGPPPPRPNPGTCTILVFRVEERQRK